MAYVLQRLLYLVYVYGIAGCWLKLGSVGTRLFLQFQLKIVASFGVLGIQLLPRGQVNFCVIKRG